LLPVERCGESQKAESAALRGTPFPIHFWGSAVKNSLFGFALLGSLIVLAAPRSACAEDLLIGAFEGTLESPFGTWEVQNGTSSYVTTGATQGTMAIEHIALEDRPDDPATEEVDPYEGNGWVFRLYLDGGPTLASTIATYDTLSFDINVPELIEWRQAIVVLQGDGGSGYFANWSNAFVAELTAGQNNVTFDLSDPAAGNIKAAAQPGTGTPQWAQFFLVIQGDYDAAPFVHQIDNIRFSQGGGSGDFSGEGIVDDIDLILWRDGYGMTGQTDAFNGDGDGDGNVDGRDFLIWQRTLTPPAAAASIPEPSAGVLGAVMGLGVLGFGRRRTSQERTI
jgi:hypothetical protein